MASLRLAFFVATFAFLLAALASSSPLPPPPPAVVQRDVVCVKAGWTMTVPSPAGNGTGETLTEWADRQRFHVGEVLDFKNWNGTVLLLARRGDYERCGAGAGTTASLPSPFAEGGGCGGTEFQLDRPGTFYFVSGVPGRCQAGQRMAVLVGEAPVGWEVPDPADTTPPPPPVTVVFKVTTSAWLWVATVFFVGVLLLVICCCLKSQAPRDKGLSRDATV